MGKSFDIGLERLTGIGVPRDGLPQEGGAKPPLQDGAGAVSASLEEKTRTLKGAGCGTHTSEGATFYLETFGCQMNDHDSEKVAGVLLARGYRQVDGPEAAKVILYNTCSIREKAAQKVFSRLGELRPVGDVERRWMEERELGLKKADLEIGAPGEEDSEQRAGRVKTRRLQSTGKIIGVLGCVAQQEGEGIFERAPWVSLVCGSASYRKLPQLIAELEAGNRRVTGLDTDTDETFETEITRRDNPFRAYLTIIEGCDKACAYCVVPYTRGPERSRSSASILQEVRQLA